MVGRIGHTGCAGENQTVLKPREKQNERLGSALPGEDLLPGTDKNTDLWINQTAETVFSELLKQLKAENPQIHFVVEQTGSGEERDILADVLDEMGDGYTLILSREFMEGLHAGRESYEKKTGALIECVKKLSACPASSGVFLEEDRAVFWKTQMKQQTYASADCAPDCQPSEDDMLFAGTKKETEEKEIRLSAGSGYSISSAYAKMAAARTKTAVQTVMRQTRRDIVSLKNLAAYSEGSKKTKLKAAVRSLEKLLVRGNSKLRRFDEESLVRTRKKLAAEREQSKRELQAELELKRRKTSGAVKDGVIRTEGRLDQINILGYRNKDKFDWKQENDAPVQTAEISALPAGNAVPVPASEIIPTEIVQF